MPSKPSTEPPNGLRDHGLLYNRAIMESVSRPMLLDSNFRASVRENAALFDYGSSGLKLADHSVPYPRSPTHNAVLLKDKDDSKEERDIIQTPSKLSNVVGAHNANCSVVSIADVSDAQDRPSMPRVICNPQFNSVSQDELGRQLAENCDIASAQLSENSHRDDGELSRILHTSPCSSVSAEITEFGRTAVLPVNVLDAHFSLDAEDVSCLPVESYGSQSETSVIPDVAPPEHLPLEAEDLTRLLAALTSPELEIYDDLMESLVDVITNDILTDEMSEGHRPTEPTPDEIDGMLNTWEDLFQNPFEYMLHSLESCPNCGRMIALSRMAPHIVSSCGENRLSDVKKKRRKGLGPPERQTRSSLNPSKHLPSTSQSDSLLAGSQGEAASTQNSCSSDMSLDIRPVPEMKPDPRRMCGLEAEILRLKRRASMETSGGNAKRIAAPKGFVPDEGLELETPSTSQISAVSRMTT